MERKQYLNSKRRQRTAELANVQEFYQLFSNELIHPNAIFQIPQWPKLKQ
jgi:hypothetical protein